MIDKNNQEKHDRNIHLSKKKNIWPGLRLLKLASIRCTHLMENYEIKAIDLRKHQPLGAASKAIQHTHFTERLYGIAKANMSFSSFTRRTLKE